MHLKCSFHLLISHQRWSLNCRQYIGAPRPEEAPSPSWGIQLCIGIITSRAVLCTNSTCAWSRANYGLPRRRASTPNRRHKLVHMTPGRGPTYYQKKRPPSLLFVRRFATFSAILSHLGQTTPSTPSHPIIRPTARPIDLEWSLWALKECLPCTLHNGQFTQSQDRSVHRRVCSPSLGFRACPATCRYPRGPVLAPRSSGRRPQPHSLR